MDTFAQLLGTFINQVCVVGGERWAGVSRGVDGGELGVTILAQKCEWVTHTLRGSHTPPLGGPAEPLLWPEGLRLSIGQLDSQWWQGVWLVAYLCLQQVRQGQQGAAKVGLGWLGVCR
jgi:hypothetical protein